jgi:hypothetical protein
MAANYQRPAGGSKSRFKAFSGRRLRSLDVTNADGKPLRQEICRYTLNQIPK